MIFGVIISAIATLVHSIQGRPVVKMPAKVRIYSGPEGLFLAPEKIDLHEKYGLHKFKGLIVIYQPELVSPKPSTIAEPPIANERQRVLEAIESGNRLSAIPATPKNSPEAPLFEFARTLWFHSSEKASMGQDWASYISPRDYHRGLKANKLRLADTFAKATESFSDTPEVQMLLSRRMIKEDSTNPIAWWYLANDNKNYLRAQINLDWEAQLRPILLRMGNWKIGKECLTKAFKENH